MTRRRIALLGALLVAIAAMLLWWAYPPTPQEPVVDARPRVRQPKRPAWIRRQLLRRPRVPSIAEPDATQPTDLDDTGDDAPDSLATLEGFVVDEAGRPLAGARVLFRCVLLEEDDEPGFIGGMSDADGYFEFDVTAPAWCSGRAYRMDGLLKAVSIHETVQLEIGDAVEVEFGLPARAGGLGVSFDAVDGSIVVLQVHDGTPASRAGLRSGDSIISIEGEPVPDNTDDFLSRMVGPVGTQVQFTISYQGEDGPVQEVKTITRAYLDSSLIQ